MRNRTRKRQNGQALIEMALTFPLVLMLIFNFIAIMILAVDEQEMQASVAAAAESTLAAPTHDQTLINAYAACSFAGQSADGVDCTHLAASFPQHSGFVVITKNITCTTSSGGNTCTASATIHFEDTVLGAFVWWDPPALSATYTVYPSSLRAQCPEGQNC
jgi:Flp pilus assembly protein TadG